MQKNAHTDEQKTEQRIVQAAMRVFMDRGFDGARMQAIADEAGINKALLHYYFRSKDQLFATIFKTLSMELYSVFAKALGTEQSFLDKIRMIVSDEIDFLVQRPNLPLFIVREITRDAERFQALVQQSAMRDIFLLFGSEVQRAIQNNEIIAIDAMQLLMNLLAIIRFPFIARPMLMAVSGMSNEQFAALQERRKHEAAEFIIRSIRP